MGKAKKICVISNNAELKHSLQSMLDKGYQTVFVYSEEDLAPSLIQAQLFIFDESNAYRFFCVKKDISIDPTQVIIIGADDSEKIRHFYSIGLTHFIVGIAFQALLKVKVEFMLGELISQGQMSLLELKNEEQWQDLTYKERKILLMLCHRPDQVIDRIEIIKYVWQNRKVHSRTFDVHLHNLRKKIEKYGYEIITHGQGKYQIQHMAAMTG